MESLWGDWLPRMVADMDAAEPTPGEKKILREAASIKAAHKARLDKIVALCGHR
jgi:hypothetical protein